MVTQSKLNALAVQGRARDMKCMYVCGPVSRNALAPMVESETSANAGVEVTALTDVERVVESICSSLADDVDA